MNLSFRYNSYLQCFLALNLVLLTQSSYAAETPTPIATIVEGDNPGALEGITAAGFLPAIGGAEPQLATVGTDKNVHLWQWREGKLLKSWPGLLAPAYQLIVAPDGQTMATASWNYVEGKIRDAEVRTWSLPDGQSKTLPPPSSELKRIAFWPDAKTLTVQGFQKTPSNPEAVILLYDVASGALQKSLTNHYPLAFDTQEKTLLEGHLNLRTTKALPGIGRWNLVTGDFEATLWPVTADQKARGTLPQIASGEFSSDAKRVAVLSRDVAGYSPVLRMYQTASLRPLFMLTSIQGDPISTFRIVQFAGRLLVTQEGIGVGIWDAEGGDLLATLPTVSNVLAISPDGRWLAAHRKAVKADATPPKPSSNIPSEVQIWDISRYKPLKEVKSTPLVAGDDGARTLQAPDIQPGPVNTVAFSTDGKRLVSGNGNLLIAWDAQTGARLNTRTGTGGGGVLAVSPDGRWILTGGVGDNIARLWDAQTLSLDRELGQHEWGINTVAFSPDSRLALAASSGVISIWEVATGKRIKQLATASGSALSLTFSPDGKLLATGNRESGINLWSMDKLLTDPALTASQPDRSLSVNTFDPVQKLFFSPDSKRLFAATLQGSVQVFDVEANKPSNDWRTNDGNRLFDVALSPDTKYMATISGSDYTPRPGTDGTLKIWEAQSGKLQRTLIIPKVPARSVAFHTTPQGVTLAVGMNDGSIKLWPLSQLLQP